MANGLKGLGKHSDIATITGKIFKKLHQVLDMKVQHGVSPNGAYLRIEF